MARLFRAGPAGGGERVKGTSPSCGLAGWRRPVSDVTTAVPGWQLRGMSAPTGSPEELRHWLGGPPTAKEGRGCTRPQQQAERAGGWVGRGKAPP